jgi:two-component system, sporulation sensor kinase E
MDDAPPPDVHLSQSLAVLRQCITTLDATAIRVPTETHVLQETVGALRGVEAALHHHLDALRRDYHFATLGRLAAGLSHEIRNPLGMLFLHVDLLEEEFRNPSEESPRVIPQTFHEIRTALARLDALVQDYLALVRVGAIEPSVQDLGAAVQEWTGEMDGRAAQQGVRIQLAGLERVGALAFHASTLRRAVLNVVHNALEAMPQGGTLTLECVRTATAVQLRVADSGTGIPAEHVTRIFEPLYTTKPGGTGMGLYIVQETLIAHGGRITVESVEGQGSTFTFMLPVS